MSWWKLIYWGIGGSGIGILIALAVFYPLVLAAVWKVVRGAFEWVLSYRLGCALVAALVAWIAADYRRHSMDDAFYAEKTAAFTKAQDDRDKRIATETRADVRKEIADATAANAVTNKDVKDFTDALPKPPETGNPFRVGADACRLRHIAGQAQCGPVRAKRVPTPHARATSTRDR